MDILKLIGSAVCHQSPDRSLSALGETLPLCARCLGVQLGLLCGLLCIALTGRLRSGGFPARWVLIPLAVGPVLNLADVSLPLIGLVDPGGNVRRLVLGSMLGSSAAYVLVPAFVRMLTINWKPEPSVRSPLEAIGAVTLSIVLTMTVALEGGVLSRAAGLASTVSLLLVIIGANIAVVKALSRPGVSAARLAALSFAFAVCEIGLGSVARMLLFPHL